MAVKRVIKLSGGIEEFRQQKIANSIWMAAQKVGGRDRDLSVKLGQEVLVTLQERYPNGESILTTEIGELVERVLVERGHTSTAQEFIRYRENKKHLRQDKASLGIRDDIGLSYNTLYILKQRYLRRNEKGEITETPKGMIKRVATFLSATEKTKKLQNKWYKEFYEIMSKFEFLPGTRTLANSGKQASQLANCFVWP